MLLLTFSEFGRRVQENGSAGTDHRLPPPRSSSSAARVKAGALSASHPSLTELEMGSHLKHHTDFRQVYAMPSPGQVARRLRAQNRHARRGTIRAGRRVFKAQACRERRGSGASRQVCPGRDGSAARQAPRHLCLSCPALMGSCGR